MQTVTRRAWGSGSVTTRRDGRVQVSRAVNGQRVYAYGATEAEAWRALAAKAPTTSRRSREQTESTRSFLAGWLETVRPSMAIRTYAGYAAIVEQAIVPELGTVPLARLGRRDVERAVGKWAADRHPRTVQHYLACLRTALGKAVEWGYLDANPAAKMKTPRIPESTIAPFSAEDETKFLAFVAEDPLYALYLAGFRTGMRQGELLGLHWSEVDTKRREITVRRTLVRVPRTKRGDNPYRYGEPKTPKSRRVIPIGPTLAEALEAHRKASLRAGDRLEQGLVFTTAAGGPLPNHAVSRTFAALCLAARVTPHRFHDMRHTFATRLLERGERMDVVRDLLGHSTITTTMQLYAHVTEQGKRAAIARLEGVG